MKIGLRIPGTARELPFDEFCRWCVDNGFDAVDISSVTPEIVGTARDAGLVIGTADLPGTNDLLSVDKSKQEAGAAAAKAAIQAAVDNNVYLMFCVFVCRQIQPLDGRQPSTVEGNCPTNRRICRG